MENETRNSLIAKILTVQYPIPEVRSEIRDAKRNPAKPVGLLSREMSMRDSSVVTTSFEVAKGCQ